MSPHSATLPLTVPEAARSRHAVRAYTPEPIPQAELDAILREVSLAPSAFNLQPWRFVVVRDAAARKQLAGVAYNQRQVTAAPAVIVLWTDMVDTLAHLDEVIRPGATEEQAASFRSSIAGSFGKQDAADREAWGHAQGFIALGYLMLVAQAHGYATSPMGGFDPEGVKQLLGLPANARITALIAIGHGAEPGAPHHRHPLERIVRVV